jgi:hypothetical protein
MSKPSSSEKSPSKRQSFFQYVASFFRVDSSSSSTSLSETNVDHSPSSQKLVNRNVTQSSPLESNWKVHSNLNVKKYPGTVKQIKSSDAQRQEQISESEFLSAHVVPTKTIFGSNNNDEPQKREKSPRISSTPNAHDRKSLTPLPSNDSSHNHNNSRSSLQISSEIVVRHNNNMNGYKRESESPQPLSLRMKRFKSVLSARNVDIEALKKLCWNGIPSEYRDISWKLLLDYLPTNSERREMSLSRKRKEYNDWVNELYNLPDANRSDYERAVYRQIHIDIPRTNPTIPLFQHPKIQQLLERILYIWSIRHPASGYVQGINDLTTPFLVVFLSAFVDGDVETCDVDKIEPKILDMVEADAYWCVSKFIDNIQDHYTFAQPGIQRMIYKLKELIQKIDKPLHDHMEQQGIQFLQFAFRWMNCLMIRELPLRLSIRLWDTYLAEGQFSVLHVYVCAAFLTHWSKELQEKDFQEMMLFLQRPHTSNWDISQLEVLISQAYLWKMLYHDAPSHLKVENAPKTNTPLKDIVFNSAK